MTMYYTPREMKLMAEKAQAESDRRRIRNLISWVPFLILVASFAAPVLWLAFVEGP